MLAAQPLLVSIEVFDMTGRVGKVANDNQLGKLLLDLVNFPTHGKNPRLPWGRAEGQAPGA